MTNAIPLLAESFIFALAFLGLIFALLFATSVRFRTSVPGYKKVREGYHLLMANRYSDLRSGFVWFPKMRKRIDSRAFGEKSRITGWEAGLAQWQSPIGTFWLPAAEGIDSLMDMAPVLQYDLYTYEGRGVKCGDVVADCGAHVGAFTRKALDKGAQLVLAIEPASERIACLRKNFAAEILAGRVRVLQTGLWSHDDTLWLAANGGVGDSVASRVIPGQGQGEWVRVTTLDKIIIEQQLDRVDFVKMDIEGAEKEALQGARKVITNYRPFLAIGTEHTEDWAQNSRNVMAAMKSSGAKYRIGFGRYGRRDRNHYAPMEMFFYP